MSVSSSLILGVFLFCLKRILTWLYEHRKMVGPCLVNSKGRATVGSPATPSLLGGRRHERTDTNSFLCLLVRMPGTSWCACSQASCRPWGAPRSGDPHLCDKVLSRLRHSGGLPGSYETCLIMRLSTNPAPECLSGITWDTDRQITDFPLT